MRKIPLGNLNSNNPIKHLLKSIMQIVARTIFQRTEPIAGLQELCVYPRQCA